MEENATIHIGGVDLLKWQFSFFFPRKAHFCGLVMKVVVEGYVFPKCRTICNVIWKSDEATHLGNCI